MSALAIKALFGERLVPGAGPSVRKRSLAIMLCPMVHDVVVVGGGSAGCILATRLSEDPARNVLLIEAGRDYRTREGTPADLLNALEVYYNPTYDWGFFSEQDQRGRSIRLWRTRVMGGCS